MIVYRVTGNEIGPNSNGAMYFAKKAEAEKALREHRAADADRMRQDDVERIEINGRDQLAAALNDAMGYGAS
jgi:hypothetical protein